MISLTESQKEDIQEFCVEMIKVIGFGVAMGAGLGFAMGLGTLIFSWITGMPLPRDY